MINYKSFDTKVLNIEFSKHCLSVLNILKTKAISCAKVHELSK